MTIPRKLLMAALLLSWAGSPGSALAQTWTGQGIGNSNWNNALNWSGGNIPNSSPTTSIVFGASTRLNPYQNLSSTFLLNSLTFNSSAGPYTLGGGALLFLGAASINQNSAAGQIIAENVIVDSSLTFNGAGSALIAGC